MHFRFGGYLAYEAYIHVYLTWHVLAYAENVVVDKISAR